MNYVEKLDRPLTNNEVDFNIDSLATRLRQVGAEDMSLILRRDLSRPLTSREMDNNFQSLDLAVGDILYGDGPRPSLDLRFSGARFLDPRITFTRDSTATYYDATGKLVTAAPNEPRFDYDPATGESRGLLIEGQATNMLLWSEDFTQGVWLYDRVAVIPEATIAPDGSMTASKLVESTDEGLHRLRQTASLIEGRAVLSIYLKASERHLVQVRNFSGSYGTVTYRIDLLTGETTMPSAAFGSAVGHDVLPGGWMRLYCSADFFNGAVFEMLDGNGLEDATNNYQGDGTSGIYIWGAQLEEGTHPTSYIPTEGSQVTRAADNVHIVMPEQIYTNRRGTVFCEFELTDISINMGIFYLGTQNNQSYRINGLATRAGGGNLRFYYRGSGAAALVSRSYGVAELGVVYRAAFSWDVDLGIYRTSVNGEYEQINDDLLTDTLLDTIYLSGRNHGIGSFTPGTNSAIYRGVRYFPRALSNAELQALTS